MKVAFFHDYRFSVDSDEQVYSTAMGDDVWNHYLEAFDEIIVAGRRKLIGDYSIERHKGLRKESNDKVSFMHITAYNQMPDVVLKSNQIREQIREVLKKVDCAIIRLPSIIGCYACHEAISMGKPWLVEVVGCAYDALWNLGAKKAKILSLPFFGFNRYYISKASHVIYVTEKFLQNRYPNKGATIGCSDVAIGSVDVTVLNKRLRKIKQGFSNNPIVFGIIGSLNVDYKGHETAMLALASLKDKFDFRLRFLGGGNTDRWVSLATKLGINEKLEFSGSLPSGEAVFDWMDSIDIFLIPSLTEGLPRGLVEAMSRGLPAIGSSVGGIEELLRGTVLHKPKDYNEMRSIIEFMIKDPNVLLESATLNFEESKKYSTSILAEKRLRFLIDFRSFVENKTS